MNTDNSKTSEPNKFMYYEFTDKLNLLHMEKR